MIVGTVLRVALGALAGLGLGTAALSLLPPLLAPQDQALETRSAAALPEEAPAAPAAPEAPAAAPAALETDTAASAQPEPQPDPRPAADPAAVLLGPGFDTVRIEPHGTGLVAGRAEPGALVSVLAGEEPVAEVAADSEGRFVAFLSLPAFEAPRALSLRDEAGRSSEETVILAPTAMPPAAEPGAPEATIAALEPRPAAPASEPATSTASASTDPSAAVATPGTGAPASDRMPAAVEPGAPESTIAALEPRPAAPTPGPPSASPDPSTSAAAPPELNAPFSDPTEGSDTRLRAADPNTGERQEALAEAADSPAPAPADQALRSPEGAVLETPVPSAPSEVDPAATDRETASAEAPDRDLAAPAAGEPALAAALTPERFTSGPEVALTNSPTSDETVAADDPATLVAAVEASPSPSEPTASPLDDASGEAAVAGAPEVTQPPTTAALSPALGAGAPGRNVAPAVPGQDIAGLSPASNTPAVAPLPDDAPLASPPPTTAALAPSLEPGTVDPATGLVVPGTDVVGAGPASDSPVAAPRPDQAPSASLPPVVAGSAPALDAPEPPQPPGQAPVLLSDAQGVRVLQPALPSGAAPEVLATVALDAIAYDGSGEVVLSGRGSGGTVRLYLDNEPAGEAAIGEDGQWMASLPEAAPGVYTLRLDQLDAAGEVVSRIETPFKREERASLQSAMAEAQEAGQTIAVRVVQPGHTLWAIARDRYGEGMMFLSVFEANRNRIRDPDLIYPGQVFVLPATQGR